MEDSPRRLRRLEFPPVSPNSALSWGSHVSHVRTVLLGGLVPPSPQCMLSLTGVDAAGKLRRGKARSPALAGGLWGELCPQVDTTGMGRGLSVS